MQSQLMKRALRSAGILGRSALKRMKSHLVSALIPIQNQGFVMHMQGIVMILRAFLSNGIHMSAPVMNCTFALKLIV